MGKIDTLKTAAGDFLRTCWQWLKAAFSPALTTFLALLFIATFVWVIFANIVWPAQNAHFFRETREIDADRTIETWGPYVIPAEAADTQIEFTLHQKNISNTPLTLTVTLPSELLVDTDEPNRFAKEIDLHFSGGLADETQTLKLINDQIVGGIRIVNREVRLTIQPEAKNAPWEHNITLGVEPTWRAVLRRYGGEGNNVPLFPLVTLLVSVSGWIYQEMRQRRKDEQERREKAKGEVIAALVRLRQEIKSGRIEAAAQTLAALQQSQAEAYLDKSDLHLAGQLLALAKGDLEGVSLNEFADDWMAEAAAALAYAVENNPTNRQALEALLRQFPADRLEDENLQSRLETIKTVLGAKTPIQGWDWPPHPPKVEIPSFSAPVGGITKNPFPFAVAEEEENFLFAQSRPLFWPKHPLFAALTNCRGALIISGEQGSGKTALAMALGKYRYVVNDRAFSCYLAGAPDILAIRRTLANRLLAFVEHLPSFLAFLGEEQRRLLAYTLLAELPHELILGRLEYASQPDHWEWLKNAPAEKAKIWRAETVTHLRLLRQVVTECSPTPCSETQWWLAFQGCLRSLGFDQSAYIVLDAGSDFSWTWYEEVILPNRHRWADLGIHTITFCTANSSLSKMQGRDGLQTFALKKWNEEHLLEMLNWRWNSLYRLKPMAGVFSKEGLNIILKKASSNPRRLGLLWNAVWRSQKYLPISETDVQNAAENPEWK